ncbi:hypothetical protein D3C81_1710450 [compost metagenome]
MMYLLLVSINSMKSGLSPVISFMEQEGLSHTQRESIQSGAIPHSPIRSVMLIVCPHHIDWILPPLLKENRGNVISQAGHLAFTMSMDIRILTESHLEIVKPLPTQRRLSKQVFLVSLSPRLLGILNSKPNYQKHKIPLFKKTHALMKWVFTKTFRDKPSIASS